ncbi:MAG: DUF4079 family protein [Deltaproteobacteria bacterium]
MLTTAEKVLAFLHPLIGLVALVLLFRAASLGLRSRERRGAPLRAQHAKAAPRALAATLLAFVMGLVSTILWRPDLELAGGWHFRIGAAIVLLLGAGALLSRHIHDSQRARRIHPLLGATALLLAAVQVFLGLPLLRF